jgi:hypothetical protein
MTRQGSNPDDLDRLASTFEHAAERLDVDLDAVRALAGTVGWSGHDATELRHRLDVDLGPRTRRSTERLRRAADDLRRNAEEQRQASSGGEASLDLTEAVAAGGLSIDGRPAATPSPEWLDNPRIAALMSLLGAIPVAGTGVSLAVAFGENLDAGITQSVLDPADPSSRAELLDDYRDAVETDIDAMWSVAWTMAELKTGIPDPFTVPTIGLSAVDLLLGTEMHEELEPSTWMSFLFEE